VEECQSAGQLCTLPIVSAKPRWEYLEQIAKELEQEDRIVTCVPITSDASICLVVFRDCGTSVFDAHVVSLCIYHRNHEEVIMTTLQEQLLRSDFPSESKWIDALRAACNRKCGDPNKLEKLRTFADLRSETRTARHHI